MGYEHGSIFVYRQQLWFFEGYSRDVDLYQTLKLRGVEGVLAEPRESECVFILSPSDIDYDSLEEQLNDN